MEVAFICQFKSFDERVLLFIEGPAYEVEVELADDVPQHPCEETDAEERDYQEYCLQEVRDKDDGGYKVVVLFQFLLMTFLILDYFLDLVRENLLHFFHVSFVG